MQYGKPTEGQHVDKGRIEDWQLVPTRGSDRVATWSVKGTLNGKPWMTSTIVSATKDAVTTQSRSIYRLGTCAMVPGQMMGAMLRDKAMVAAVLPQIAQ